MSDSTRTAEKSEIETLVEMITANPFPRDIEAARAAMDSLGTPVSEDVTIEKMDMGGVPCQMLTPSGADESCVIMYLHGGGYALGSLDSHAGLAAEIGKAARACVLQVDYRLAPEHPFPAAVDDACMVYRALIGRGLESKKITLAGDSAGGGLVLATILTLKEANEPLPGAAVCLSPWTDLEFTGESIELLRDRDPIIDMDVLGSLVDAYMAGQDPKDPKASPLHADLAGFPPMLIQVGECEVLLSDAERLASRASEASLDVVFERWPEMIHVWQLFYPHLTQGRTAIARIGDFIREKTSP